ncbi:MAG: hypothetical protein JXR25_01875 [Pontiellaceae bacterium]|nr:hypothetical protein [Pontiellaceae bacterium]MBN2783547.1 hypothetical protein [Pontiellaceae bacterium]
MLKRMLTVVFAFIMALAVRAEEYRVFTDAQGRAIEAKIISYDSVKAVIEMERKDGQRFKVSPKLFSEDDRTYIRQWIDAYRILSDDSLQVSFSKKNVDSFKEGLTDVEVGVEAHKGDIICYEMTFKNRSKKPIENLKLEYRIFVMVKDKENGDSVKKLETQTASIATIEPGKSITIKTVEATVEEKYTRTKIEDPRRGDEEDSVRYEYDKVSEEDLMGIWLKIYGPVIEGEPTVRDVCDPDKLPKESNWDGKLPE